MPETFSPILNSQMGNKSSKRKEREAKASAARESTASVNDDLVFDRLHADWLDDPELKIMRRNIESNPDLFVLNNLMMSVQFFENFEEEVTKIRHTLLSTREAEINSCLPPQKHSLIPDVLQEQIAKNVDFMYTRPSSILSVEPLQPIRIFIVFDNIEVTEQSHVSPYSSVNETVTYNMQLKQSKHKGYAILQRLEVNPSNKKPHAPSDDAIYSDDESIYNKSTGTNSPQKSADTSRNSTPVPSEINDEDAIYPKSRPKPSGSPSGSTSSGYRSGNNTIDSDSEGGYGSTTKTDPMTSEIPRSCFTYTTEDKIYGVRKPRPKQLNQKERLIRGVMHSKIYKVWYLSSQKFMNYFYRLFTDELAAVMGFDPENQDEPDGAVIYRDKWEVLESATTCLKDENFAISPCVWSAWPEAAQEFLNRPRGAWPEFKAMEKLKEVGCHLVPEGYCTEGSGNNDLQNLEWEIVFPGAEKVLESFLSHSQVRVLVMALILQKTFFRPIESIIGLTGAHIRHQLFWLIEEDERPYKWCESRTGECLLKLLSSLYKAISQEKPHLPDYFLKDKNLFQGKIYLLRTQKQLQRIIKNPVMYILHAMQNIGHSKTFFPRLDSSRLLRILTDEVLTLINPHLAGSRPVSVSKGGPELIEDNEEPTYGFFDHEKQKKEKSQIYSARRVTKKSIIDAEESSDQVVNIEVMCAQLEPRRLTILLDFFISHFLKVAEYYHNYGNLSQKTAYIEHAERLCVLLSEYSSNRKTVKNYLEKLKLLKRRVINSKSRNDPPETPKRNSDKPVFTAPLKARFQPPVESHSILRNSSNEDISEGIPRDKTYNKQTSVKKQVTMAVVHEIAPEVETVEMRSHQESTQRQKIVSLTQDEKDSYLSETTHI